SAQNGRKFRVGTRVGRRFKLDPPAASCEPRQDVACGQISGRSGEIFGLALLILKRVLKQKIWS
ncbi:MAG TPA: hypothetical protein VF472_16715, partial [Burkholderiaceae bacterium]